MKRTAQRALRRLRLLGAADRCLLAARRMAAAPDNARFRRAHPEFALPPAALFHEVFNDCRWESYRESGLRHARLYAALIARHAGRPPADVLEWGCGPGRILRHMPAQGGAQRWHGTDVDGAAIDWCRAQLPGIAFAHNAGLPPTPFPDAAFDVIYSFSVFTHLHPETQLAWAREVRRLLRPGGLFLTTTQGEEYRPRLPPELRVRFDAGEPVVQDGVPEGRKWFFAFQPRAFVTGRLLAGFARVERLPNPPELGVEQDLWAAWR